MSKIIEGLKYSETHEWVKVEGDIAIIGVTDFAASDLFSPVSGTVTEVNEDVVDDPKLVNDDAFENWIIKVQMSDASELDDLMDASAYKAFIKE